MPVVGTVKRETLEIFINQAVSIRVSLLWTIDFRGCIRLHYRYPDAVANHGKGQYVMRGIVGAIHTNSIEGFWSLIKRDIVQTFHKVNKKYLRSVLPNSNSGTTIARTRTSLGRPLADAK